MSQLYAVTWRHITQWVSYYFNYSIISELDFCQGKYCKWAQDSNYESRLPGDIKKCKAAAEYATRTLDHDLKEKKIKDWVVPYSDKSFNHAMIEWLVATDQVSKILVLLVVVISFEVNTNIFTDSQYKPSNTWSLRRWLILLRVLQMAQKSQE